MKELEPGQRVIAEMDYLENTGRESQTLLLYEEVDRMKQYGPKKWTGIMDLIEDKEYGKAFNYVEEVSRK